MRQKEDSEETEVYATVQISSDKLKKTWAKCLQNVKGKSWGTELALFWLSFWNQFGLTGEDRNHCEKNPANKVTQF